MGSVHVNNILPVKSSISLDSNLEQRPSLMNSENEENGVNNVNEENGVNNMNEENGVNNMNEESCIDEPPGATPGYHHGTPSSEGSESSMKASSLASKGSLFSLLNIHMLNEIKYASNLNSDISKILMNIDVNTLTYNQQMELAMVNKIMFLPTEELLKLQTKLIKDARFDFTMEYLRLRSLGEEVYPADIEDAFHYKCESRILSMLSTPEEREILKNRVLGYLSSEKCKEIPVLLKDGARYQKHKEEMLRLFILGTFGEYPDPTGVDANKEPLGPHSFLPSAALLGFQEYSSKAEIALQKAQFDKTAQQIIDRVKVTDANRVVRSAKDVSTGKESIIF